MHPFIVFFSLFSVEEECPSVVYSGRTGIAHVGTVCMWIILLVARPVECINAIVNKFAVV